MIEGDKNPRGGLRSRIQINSDVSAMRQVETGVIYWMPFRVDTAPGAKTPLWAKSARMS